MTGGRAGEEPRMFRRPGQPVLYLAGFYNALGAFSGAFSGEGRFVVLTGASGGDMSRCHSRMPLLLRPEETLPWLRGQNTEAVPRRQPLAARPHDAYRQRLAARLDQAV